MIRKLVCLSVTLTLATALFAQPDKPNKVDATPAPASAASSEVEGLKLPKSFSVPHDEGFVTITAECKGQVQWLILTANPVRIKYKATANPPEVDIAIPPVECVLSVFAVAVIDGKITPFVRTDITVTGPRGPPGPGPGPGPGPKPPILPPGTKLHVTVVEDPAKRTVAITNVVESAKVIAELRQDGHVYRVYSVRDPEVVKKRLDQFVAKAGGVPALIIQTDDGIVQRAIPLPTSADELLTTVRDLVGKK